MLGLPGRRKDISALTRLSIIVLALQRTGHLCMHCAPVYLQCTGRPHICMSTMPPGGPHLDWAMTAFYVWSSVDSANIGFVLAYVQAACDLRKGTCQIHLEKFNSVHEELRKVSWLIWFTVHPLSEQIIFGRWVAKYVPALSATCAYIWYPWDCCMQGMSLLQFHNRQSLTQNVYCHALCLVTVKYWVSAWSSWFKFIHADLHGLMVNTFLITHVHVVHDDGMGLALLSTYYRHVHVYLRSCFLYVRHTTMWAATECPFDGGAIFLFQCNNLHW